MHSTRDRDETAMGHPLIKVDNLQVRFENAGHANTAVDGVSFQIAAGERYALVGESGSGKTVTALSILRLLPDAITHGAILWSPAANGSSNPQTRNLIQASDREMRAIRGSEIAMVFQEPMSALNPLFTVGDQIAEVLELHEGLSRKAALEKAVSLLERTGIDEPARRARSFPHQLSGGQRQRVVIAMALACGPKLLIADEPTTALDVTVREQVLEMLLKLQREDGMAILLITHDLPLVERFANRVGVMQSGRLVEQAETATLFSNPQHEYTRRLLSSRPQRLVGDGASNEAVLLNATHVRCQFTIPTGWWSKRIFTAVNDATLSVRHGETLGVVGESGSGKSTLALALLRLSAANVQGEVLLDGNDLFFMNEQTLRPLRRRMQIVFQDPFSALSPRMTVGQILEEGLKLHFSELSRDERTARCQQMLQEVGLPENSLYRYPHEFSGGQRQRIAIPRAVILQPDLLVLDEPTSALDVSIQQQVLELLVKLQRKHGMSYVFISHDLAGIRAMSHRVMVMQHGEVVESGVTTEVLDRPKTPYTQQLIRAAFATEKL